LVPECPVAGITFVPDESLLAGGFVDGSGVPYVSTNGMNGLMFVAHQNGGRIYVFDLNRSDGTYIFVGEFSTSYSESAGLEFDRSTHQLYIWHGGVWNYLEITELSSYVNGSYRRLQEVTVYDPPHGGNLEGFARTQSDDPRTWIFLTIDDGGSDSLDWYHPDTPTPSVTPPDTETPVPTATVTNTPPDTPSPQPTNTPVLLAIPATGYPGIFLLIFSISGFLFLIRRSDV